MKKRYLLVALAGLLGWQANAQDAQWLRYPAISPDGQTVAFTYKSNLYKVSTKGGTALPVSVQEGYEYMPVWSPDGQQLAFASNRNGNFDVFVAPSAGGMAKRLTFHSRHDLPVAFSADSKNVLFNSNRQMNVENAQFPYGRFHQLYQVSTAAERPQLLQPAPMEAISVDASGKRFLYQDLKGYEDTWRKHHTSSIARDIWLYDAEKQAHTQLSTFEGEDRNPVWAPDGQYAYYLSEASGTFNIWKMEVANPSNKTQITKFEKHPVRFLSIAKDGTLCFGYHGAIYTMKEGQQAQAIAVALPYDQEELTQFKELSSGASEMAVSPNGKEAAFVIRGEIFVASADGGMTKRITNTPEQERSVAFSPDGRKLVYAGERNGSWNIYESTIASKDEPYFYAATLLQETALVATADETFQPAYSPDGKKLAYLKNRTELMVMDLATKKSTTVLPADKNYSYSDGDQYYQWSPDSKWLLATFLDKGRWVEEIGIVPADGSQPVRNLTESGYAENAPIWVLDGKAMIYASDRYGFRSHGSWGSSVDILISFFDQAAYDRFMLDKDAFALVKEREKEEKKDGEEGKKEEKKTEIAPLAFEWTRLADRTVRLTLSSGFISDMVMSPDGETLYYISERDNSFDLWKMDVREKSVKTIGNYKGGGASLEMDQKGENLFVFHGGRISKVKTSDGSNSSVSFKAEMTLNTQAERDYLFEHIWRQVDRKFYRPDLHGIDWAGMKKEYAAKLPSINNNFDFAELMSELLGELNGSHTGCRYSWGGDGDETASLGFYEDASFQGAGVKIASIIDKSPLLDAKAGVKAGMVIEKIDGVAIAAKANYWPLLNHKAGKQVVLSLFDPSNGQRKDVVVMPISLGEESQLLYERWVKSRREATEKLSGGRIGYVHVRGMNSESFRAVFAEMLGRYADKEAIIVDTRFNGGGWLHDDLATLLSGVQYVQLKPRGQLIGSEPQNKWQGPSIVLAGEGNYSDAHFFPYAYQTLKIGKVVGMPVPGTSTAVWWERLIDPSLVFGIPQVGITDQKGQYLENQQLTPDVQVKNMPADLQQGKDAQLEKAVELLLQGLKK